MEVVDQKNFTAQFNKLKVAELIFVRFISCFQVDPK